MGHGLEQNDRMLSATNDELSIAEATPWHASMTGDRTIVHDGVITDGDEALDMIGANYSISKRPLFYWVPDVPVELAGDSLQLVSEGGETVGVYSPDGAPELVKVVDGVIWRQHATNDCHAVSRDDTGDQIGSKSVGRVFEPFQAREAIAFAQELAGGEGAIGIETLGTLHDHRMLWVMVRLDRQITIAGEEATPFLLLVDYRDGSGQLAVHCVMVRAVCKNTIRMGVRSAKVSWSTSHTGLLRHRVDEARRTLQLGTRYFDAFEEEVAQLIATPVNSTQFVEVLDRVEPMPEAKVLEVWPDGTAKTVEPAPKRATTLAEAKRATIRGLWRDETGAGEHHGNAWGVLQSFSTFDLWHRPGRGDNADESQQRRVIGGQSTTYLDKVRTTVDAVVS